MVSRHYVSHPSASAADASVNRAAARRFWDGFAEGAAQRFENSTLMDGYASQRLRLAVFRHVPHVLTEQSVPPEHRQAVLLRLQVDGRADVEQGGRRGDIGAGDFCVIDLSRPFRLDMGRGTVQTIHMPLAALRHAVPRLQDISAIGLHGHLSPVGYLRVLFQEMFSHPASLTDAVADRLADAIPHMLAAALESMDMHGDVPPSRMRQYHRRQIRQFAREHLADPALCVEMIAKGVGLSASHLFDLFSDDDTTLMRWVRMERLGRCHRELADPHLRHRSIAQIAHAWGFGDMTHFSRCFRDYYGTSPSRHRHAAITGQKVAIVSDVHTADE